MQLSTILNTSNANNNLTMSSKEIAELTGKRHDNVLRDVRMMLEELYGEEGFLRFQDTYTHEQNGQKYSLFSLPKRETLILVSGYSLTMRAKIIDRWQELEAQQNKAVVVLPNFTDPVEAATAWIEQYKAKQEALLLSQERLKLLESRERQLAFSNERLEQAKPKVEYVDLFVDKSGLRTITDVAKELGISGKALGKWLRTEGYLWDKKDKNGNSKSPNWTQSFMDKGYGEQKLVLVNEGKMSKSGVFITAKGDLFIKQKYNQPTQ